MVWVGNNFDASKPHMIQIASAYAMQWNNAGYLNNLSKFSILYRDVWKRQLCDFSLQVITTS